MTTLLIFIIGLNFGTADTLSKADKIKLVDKIVSSKHFTFVMGQSGCFSATEDRYYFRSDKKKTIEHSIVFIRPKIDPKLLSKVKLLPDDINELKKSFAAGITRDNKGRCLACCYYKITDGTNEVRFDDNTCMSNDFNILLQALDKREKK